MGLEDDDIPTSEMFAQEAESRLVLELMKLGHSEGDAIKIVHGEIPSSEAEMAIIIRKATSEIRPMLEVIKRQRAIDQGSLEIIGDILCSLDNLAGSSDKLN